MALLRRRMEEMGRGRLIGPTAERVTFEDLRDGLMRDYEVNGRRSIDRAKGCLDRLGEFFGMARALEITTDRLNSYVLHRQEDGVARATIRRELAILRRAFTLAVRAGRIPQAPAFPSLSVDNARKGFLDGETLERVVSELPEPLRPVVRFAAFTGWRKGEILSLTWGQVDFEAGVIRLEPGTTKNGEGREFPFRVLPPLAELVEAQREQTRALEREQGRIIPHVFHRDGKRIKSMRTAWDAACRRAGVPDAIFHDLRRTAVRTLERAGVSRSVAMKLTGHKTEVVYRRYAIADAAALAEGVEKLTKLHATSSAERRTVVPIREGAGSGGPVTASH
ncbi:MAG: site-specific integrase [Gemmatimonadetes bacterium]|nr:site-specific integrase [Gemmatimonadota bacterium]